MVFIFIILSFIGFLDAAYLTIKYYTNEPVVCSVFDGCERVIASSYAAIGPVSVALLGAIYYLAIFLLALVYLGTERKSILIFAARLTVIGFLASLWFIYLQLFVIEALCFYCLISAATSIILFVLGILILRNNTKT